MVTRVDAQTALDGAKVCKDDLSYSTWIAGGLLCLLAGMGVAMAKDPTTSSAFMGFTAAVAVASLFMVMYHLKLVFDLHHCNAVVKEWKRGASTREFEEEEQKKLAAERRVAKEEMDHKLAMAQSRVKLLELEVRREEFRLSIAQQPAEVVGRVKGN